MNWLLKSICVLYLSLCVFYQGLAVYVFTPEQPSPAQQSVSAFAPSVLVSLGAPLLDSTHGFPAQHEQQADKEKTPTMWEIDSHDVSSHLTHLSVNSIQIPSSENSNYPTPIYTLHRPPDVLA